MNPDEIILQDTCYYLTQEYAKSFWGKYVWLYQRKGRLSLTRNSLIFSKKSFSIDIPFDAISSIETQTFSRISKPFGLASIAINYKDSEKESVIQLVPAKSGFKPTWETNKLIASWVERIEQVPALSGKVKRPLQIPLPPSRLQMAIIKSAVVLWFLFIILFLVSIVSVGVSLNRDSFETPVLIEESSIKDSSSASLKSLLVKEDFPGNWEWEHISTQQPGEFLLDKGVRDAADTNLGARVPQFLIFKASVNIEHWVVLYDSSMSELQFMERIPVTDEDASSFVPKLNKAGKYIQAKCKKGSDFYTCEVSVGYEYVLSSMMTTTPQALGEQFTVDLLNSAIQMTDERIRKNFP